MTKKLSDSDEKLLSLAKPSIQTLDARLLQIQRQKGPSSESYDDNKPKLWQPNKSKQSLKNKPDKEPAKLTPARSRAEKEDRLLLDDNRCVVLGTGNPEVCHIIPYSVNDSEESRVKFNQYIAVGAQSLYYKTPELPRDTIYVAGSSDDDEMDVDIDSTAEELSIDEPNPADLWALYCRKRFAARVGASDKSWNEISLNSQLHAWWSEGYFAFKPLGIDGTIFDGVNAKGHPGKYTRVKLQFHWMPRRKDIGMKATTTLDASKEARPQDYTDLFNKTYGDPDTDGLNPVFAQDRRISVSHVIETGDIFYVKVESRYAERMLTAFRIQWASIRIFSLAGGAESLDDVGDHPDYLDENFEWMGYAKAGCTISDLMKQWDD